MDGAPRPRDTTPRTPAVAKPLVYFWAGFGSICIAPVLAVMGMIMISVETVGMAMLVAAGLLWVGGMGLLAASKALQERRR